MHKDGRAVFEWPIHDTQSIEIKEELHFFAKLSNTTKLFKSFS